MTNYARGPHSELVVACDLARRGYEIFMQFGSCSCDLVAVRGEVVLRVEVKSQYFRGFKAGKTHLRDLGRHDVLAVVFPGDRIQYYGLPDSPAPALGPEWSVEYVGDPQDGH